jgi:hypothetical protein
MEHFKRVEALVRYKFIKCVDVLAAVFILYCFRSYISRLVSGAVPFGPVHVLIIGILLSVELYFLKRIKRWSFDGYISVPGIFRVLSRADVRELLAGEEFVCPEEFRGTYFEKHRRIYESRNWLCIYDRFVHKNMIAAVDGGHFKSQSTLGHYDLFIILYTGEKICIRCEDNPPFAEGWENFLWYISAAAGGFLLNRYMFKGFIYSDGDIRKMKKLLREELDKQPDPKEWLLSGAAIECWRGKLAGVIEAEEAYIESTGRRRNEEIAERRRRYSEEKRERLSRRRKT